MVSVVKGLVAFVALVGSLVLPAADVPRATSVVITAAGDICGKNDPKSCAGTANRVLAIDPVVALTLGDNQYYEGSLSQYRNAYDKSWGKFKARTRPSPGNHEYLTAGAQGYRSYFGISGRTWYSFNVGDWHLVSLDSNCSRIGGCGPGSNQYQWLAADLASDSHRCTLAYWHHPRFSSGTEHGGTTAVQPFWSLLAAEHAELVLTGHEHHYERFSKQNGITEFVIGTGGVAEPGYPFGSPEPNSVKRIRGIKAVGKFTLNTGGWSMQLVTALGEVKDSASSSCS